MNFLLTLCSPKLAALKFFRTLISLHDTFYVAQMTHNNIFELILNIVYETMPRDSLLNSACLDLFEFVKRENIKTIIVHVVENYRDILKNITYVDTFQNLILRYDQLQGYGVAPDVTLFSQDESVGTPRMLINGGQRWHGVREMDAAEEEYFDTSDDEEDEVCFSSRELKHDEWGGVGEEHDMSVKFSQTRCYRDGTSVLIVDYQQDKPQRMDATATNANANANVSPPTAIAVNGSASPIVKPLVDYPDDDDEEDVMDINVQSQQPQHTELQPSDSLASSIEQSEQLRQQTQTQSEPTSTTSPDRSATLSPRFPPYRYTEKRRREEDDDDDELVKLSSGTKRRSSSLSSIGSSGSIGIGISSLRKKKSFSGVGKNDERERESGNYDDGTGSMKSAAAATTVTTTTTTTTGTGTGTAGAGAGAGVGAVGKKISINLNLSTLKAGPAGAKKRTVGTGTGPEGGAGTGPGTPKAGRPTASTSITAGDESDDGGGDHGGPEARVDTK